MQATDIIAAKRDGLPLTTRQINHFITHYTRGDIPDYQASALLMAIYLNGMTRTEAFDLTMALANSGERIDLSDVTDFAVDKHSSGGVGDKTSLVVLPLVASMGVPVAKMSGRGLGFTGGTLDKLESIPGFNINRTPQQFKAQARSIGLALAGQTGDLAPADGKLYALRDVTATVASIPLIASSIMSKKIAGGAKGIVLDVKAGSGAFMKTVEEARDLAQIMVAIGEEGGTDLDVTAVVSDMNQPLGWAVGNALELREALDTLRGEGPPQFRDHCLLIALHMLKLAGRGQQWTDDPNTTQLLARQIDSGQALAKFREMVVAQGGDPAVIDDPARLDIAPVQHVIDAQRGGYVARFAADEVGIAAMRLGAGRPTKGAPIDHSVGLSVHINVGDKVTKGQPLVTVYARDNSDLTDAINALKSAITLSDDPVAPLPLFYDVIQQA